MQEQFPRGKTAVVGAATYGIKDSNGLEPFDMAALASIEALKQAGLQPKDVDAVFIASSLDSMGGLTWAQYLGIQPRLIDNTMHGGSSFLHHALVAAWALTTGHCDTALIAYGSNQRSASGKLVRSPRTFCYEDDYKPFAPPSAYAMVAARHMHQYGTTREQLAEVAVAARKWANLNPDAFMQGDLSIQDVLNARMVSDPFTVRDCCLVTDGAGAVVMTRADRAKDLVKKPAYLLGAAGAMTHRDISANEGDITISAAAQSGPRAFAQAKIKASDVNVLEVYDAFTINTIVFLEDLGFCPKGEGGRFVEGGGIAPGGKLPVNTNGGGLSCVHPGMYGLFTMIEAVQQIAGVAGARQQRNVDIAVAHGNGGQLSSQVTNVFGSEATL
jgi:acetyl-CoA acetyltransferase